MIHEELTEKIIGAIYEVHKELGPGLFESCYEKALCFELRERGLAFEAQAILPVIYKDQYLELGFRMDIVVEDRVVIEVKSVESLHPVYSKQLLNYLKLSSKRVGFLVNFNVASLKNKESLHRIVN